MLKHPSPHAYASFYDMMQLYLAVTVEHPELSQTLNIDQSVNRMILSALFKYLDTNKHHHSVSVFDINLQRALRSLMGDYANFTNQPMTTSGYIFDGEVLLSVRNQVVRPPRAWKHRRARTVQKMLLSARNHLRSEGLKHPGNTPKNARPHAQGELGALVSSMKDVEVSSLTVPRGHDETVRASGKLSEVLQSYSSTTAPGSVSGGFSKTYVNLASDWETILNRSPNKPVARRIAIEADGPRHFATNCRHPLGHTVLKHRQLEALGWEVVSVRCTVACILKAILTLIDINISLVQLPFYEWEHLKTDQDQVSYLEERIFHEG